MLPRALLLALLALAALPAAAAAESFLGAWNGGLRAPGGLAADARGYIYVADPREDRVRKFTATGGFVRDIGASGAQHVAVGPDGHLFVSEYSDRVSVWTRTGRFVRAFGDSGAGPGQFDGPGQLAVNAAGLVYVADRGNHRVQVFDSSGAFRGAIGTGSFFTDPDKLSSPVGLALDADGSIWVADELYRRIQHYAPDGRYLGGFGSVGSGPGELSAPAALAVRPGGLLVADRSLSRVSSFGRGGDYLGALGGTPGSGPGQFSHPLGIALDCRGTVYVADTDNQRVQRFGTPGAAPCGNPSSDPEERLVAKLRVKRNQSFSRQFAIRATAACDRPCSLSLAGAVRVNKHRYKLRRVRERFADRPVVMFAAPSERAIDRVLSASRRNRRVSARLVLTAKDARNRRVVVRRSIRLRR